MIIFIWHQLTAGIVQAPLKRKQYKEMSVWFVFKTIIVLHDWHCQYSYLCLDHKSLIILPAHCQQLTNYYALMTAITNDCPLLVIIICNSAPESEYKKNVFYNPNLIKFNNVSFIVSNINIYRVYTLDSSVVLFRKNKCKKRFIAKTNPLHSS